MPQITQIYTDIFICTGVCAIYPDHFLKREVSIWQMNDVVCCQSALAWLAVNYPGIHAGDLAKYKKLQVV